MNIMGKEYHPTMIVEIDNGKAKVMASISDIEYVKLEEGFDVNIMNFNEKSGKNDIQSKENIPNAHAVLGVKPNWVQLVVHRPLESAKEQGTWIVSERESGAVIMSQKYVPKEEKTKYKIRTKDEAVLFALERIERIGKDEIIKQMKKYREVGNSVLWLPSPNENEKETQLSEEMDNE